MADNTNANCSQVDGITPEQMAAAINEVVNSMTYHLSGEVPQEPNIDITQNKVSYEDEISGVNAKVESALIDSRAKLINLYIDCEQQRLNQQSPILNSLISLTKTLIWLFNIVIAVLTVSVIVICFLKSDLSILKELFEFLKYYVGAVLVELIGLLIFIAKSVFSSNYKTIIDNILKPGTKQG